MNYEIINLKKKEKGITNAQLAKMTGITLSTLDKITSGANQNPKLGTLQAIARAIGCTLDDFDDEPLVALSSAALDIARKYDDLDEYSKKVIAALVDLEFNRPAAHSSDQSYFRKKVDEAVAADSQVAEAQ